MGLRAGSSESTAQPLQRALGKFTLHFQATSTRGRATCESIGRLRLARRFAHPRRLPRDHDGEKSAG